MGSRSVGRPLARKLEESSSEGDGRAAGETYVEIGKTFDMLTRAKGPATSSPRRFFPDRYYQCERY